ncbi:hypothetical protein FRC17_003721, partial [Serendipita sp. 399]
RAESYFIQALEAAPNISEVSMSSVKFPPAKDRGSDLLTRLEESGSEALCPKIAKLTLNGGERGILGIREGLEPLIRRVVASRTGVLQKFAVEWHPPFRECHYQIINPHIGVSATGNSAVREHRRRS